MLFLQFGESGDDRIAAGLAHDVTEKENRQHFAIFVLMAAKSSSRCLIVS